MRLPAVCLHRHRLASARIVFNLEEFVQDVIGSLDAGPHTDPHLVELSNSHAFEDAPDVLFRVDQAGQCGRQSGALG